MKLTTAFLLRAVVAAACAIAAAPAQATTLYTFAGLSQAATITTPNATASDIEFTASGFPINLCSGSNGNPPAACGPFNNTTTSFTVTALAGYALDVSGFSFDERNIGEYGPTQFEVFTSADGYTTPIAAGALAPSASAFTNHSTALALTGLSSLTVRIVSSGWDAQGNDPPLYTPWFLDNITLRASTRPASVPEPSVLLLAGAGILAAARRRSGTPARSGR